MDGELHDTTLRDLDNLASLADPVRRSVYRLVVERGGGVARQDVAATLGLSRSLAAYHLDRLVEDGLLAARFEHRGSRRGPGSGRPSKVYERAPADYRISLPPRDYGLAAGVLADALERLDAHQEVLRDAARAHGERLAAEHPPVAADPDTDHSALDPLGRRLAGCGYEPYQRDGCLRMRNCPFDAIAQTHRDLVCDMNLSLLGGMLDDEPTAPDLRLEPVDGECCVAIRPGPTGSR